MPKWRLRFMPDGRIRSSSFGMPSGPVALFLERARGQGMLQRCGSGRSLGFGAVRH
ncbi:hypothetical protein CHLRE_05g234976v5 [Chlamydomonas reinhardtii]|uniref:Uncharacterized protein n=1 Tax=Chlamydomonas reinhardtii TaxID=3055 RepID=A0A2K3DSQ1_CHLRE|nr:uncharacterized protein CHLRE_05g234976v5 [Chlamydomonas reinhardtii]PNW83566.1 hypothetical protein CHLRE_05g234976v5 [Chlamydomonas reinhardtii]